MVKFYESAFSYDYQWPVVTLAYFLRYPNPYSTHVVSSDTLACRLDAATGQLHITRLHLKRGKLPSSIARFLPKIKESYILERSVVDVRAQRLATETRNLDYESVLSVVESQVFTPTTATTSPSTTSPSTTSPSTTSPTTTTTIPACADGDDNRTDVRTVVRFESRFGAGARTKRGDDQQARRGWFQSPTWVAGGVQRNIELVGRSRMREGLVKSREGMKVVLEQLRERGLVGVVKEQRQGGWEGWRKVWRGEEVDV